MSDFFEEDAHPVEASPTPQSSFFDDDAIPVNEDTADFDHMSEALLNTLKKPASGMLDALTSPFAMMDPVTGAPPRAFVGALQRNEGLGEAGSALIDQIKAGLPKTGESGATVPGDILKSTPTGTDIAAKGLSGAGLTGPFAKTSAKVMGPVVDAGLDFTQMLPTEIFQGLGKLGAKGIGAIGGAGLKAMEAGEVAAAKTLMPVGQVMTQGAINPNKAIKAAALLTSRELMFPGTKDFGAMAQAAKDVGNARTMLQFNQTSVPGSHEVALQVSNFIEANKGRTISHPQADALIQQIRGKAFNETQKMIPQVVPPEMIEQGIQQAELALQEAHSAAFGGHNDMTGASPEQTRQWLDYGKQLDESRNQLEAIKAQYLRGEPFTVNRPVTVLEPRDLTLDQLDDITGMLDELVYTGQGNEKMLRRIWGPTLKNSRAALDKVMQTVPEGELFKDVKGKYEALATAGKHRSKLMEAMSLVGAMGTGAMTMNPSSLLILSLRPRSYYQIMAAVKAPREVLETLSLARASGKAGAVRDALSGLAAKYPEVTERLIRSTALVSGKPEMQQFLTEEEANSLGKARSFDPEEIAAERQRITSDKGMSSVLRARKLSDINKNGYVVIEQPPVAPDVPQTTEQKLFGGRKGLDDLLQSLQQ